MKIDEIRKEIDGTDNELVKLFEHRMKLVREVAEYKKEVGISIYDEGREKELLKRVGGLTDNELSLYTIKLFETVLSISREYQREIIDNG